MKRKVVIFLFIAIIVVSGICAIKFVNNKAMNESVTDNKKVYEINDLYFGDTVKIDKSKIDWIYVGKDENDVPVIVSKYQTEEKLSLGANDYINAKDIINSECEKLYSVGSLKARSINLNDVNRILKYNGPTGEYVNYSVNPVTSSEAFSIAELESRRYGWLNYRQVPANSTKKFNEYLSNFYTYIGSKYVEKSSKEYNVIFTNEEYFLASTCAEVYFDKGYVEYIVRSVGFGLVNGNALFVSNGKENTVTCRLRPVIELENDAKFELKDGCFVMI